MADILGAGWSRREFVRAASLILIATGTQACATRLAAMDQAEAPGERQIALVREAAQLVIPATDTPGAGDVGAGEFAVLALVHGLEGTRRPLADPSRFPARFVRPDGSLSFVDWLEDRLDRAVGGNWLAAPLQQRAASLAELDAEAYDRAAGDHPWRKLKALILLGYYTSEAGGSQELSYAAIPGQFDPAVPVTTDTRAFSNDWSALEFG